MSKEANESAFSLVEMVTVLFAISVLLSLVLVGVQVARETGRRASCSNNLHQLGIGIHGHVARTRALPGLGPKARLFDNDKQYVAVVSPHFQLLPDLDLSALASTPLPMSLLFEPDLSYPFRQNWKVMSMSVASFKCPSDAAQDNGGTNYRFCTGPDAYASRRETIDEGGKGVFVIGSASKTASMKGLSNLIIASERLRSRIGDFNPESDIWRSGLVPPDVFHPTADLIAAGEIATTVAPTRYYKYCGHDWLRAASVFTLYNHALAPNARGCVSLIAGDTRDGGYGSLVGATSGHSSGVNCLRGDGAVIFVSNDVDLVFWRGLAEAD